MPGRACVDSSLVSCAGSVGKEELRDARDGCTRQGVSTGSRRVTFANTAHASSILWGLDVHAPTNVDELSDHIGNRLRSVDFVRAGGTD